MLFKVSRHPYFSIVRLWSAYILLVLSILSPIGIIISHHFHPVSNRSKSSQLDLSCGSTNCGHVRYTHKHSSDKDNTEEHEHTHVIHVSHGELVFLESQSGKIHDALLAISPLLALTSHPNFFPKKTYASIFRPPIA